MENGSQQFHQKAIQIEPSGDQGPNFCDLYGFWHGSICGRFFGRRKGIQNRNKSAFWAPPGALTPIGGWGFPNVPGLRCYIYAAPFCFYSHHCLNGRFSFSSPCPPPPPAPRAFKQARNHQSINQSINISFINISIHMSIHFGQGATWFSLHFGHPMRVDPRLWIGATENKFTQPPGPSESILVELSKGSASGRVGEEAVQRNRSFRKVAPSISL